MRNRFQIDKYAVVLRLTAEFEKMDLLLGVGGGSDCFPPTPEPAGGGLAAVSAAAGSLGAALTPAAEGRTPDGPGGLVGETAPVAGCRSGPPTLHRTGGGLTTDRRRGQAGGVATWRLVARVRSGAYTAHDRVAASG